MTRKFSVVLEVLWDERLNLSECEDAVSEALKGKGAESVDITGIKELK